ncbi:MAG: hypothetical protein J6T19_04315 [Paludibacteraceae bacterium]|nr:hypothetical protein [Paludibacteraceae bacterium]
MDNEKIEIPISNKEIKDEILSVFCSRASRNNCASVVINKDDLDIVPHCGYSIQHFVDDRLKNEANKKGFYFVKDLSDDDQLVFRMK